MEQILPSVWGLAVVGGRMKESSGGDEFKYDIFDTL
jgi:hypothetical protein